MPNSTRIEHYQGMVEYSKGIFDKVIEDSDQAVQAITKVIEHLVEDSNRISKMSEDTANAIKNLAIVISEINQKTTASALKKLINALSGLITEHKTVHEIIMPIIEALQFQDALRQQMENLGKVADHWYALRANGGSPDLSEEEMKKFGEQLLACTTMQAEREIIRRHISGLPEEEKADDINLF